MTLSTRSHICFPFVVGLEQLLWFWRVPSAVRFFLLPFRGALSVGGAFPGAEFFGVPAVFVGDGVQVEDGFRAVAQGPIAI
jgi:hypothetical protein